ALTWIGDGGSSTGAFHEGLNFAAAQRAPFVLVLENNQWAYSTPVARQVPVRDLAERAKAYGIASKIVDGNDVIAVYETTKAAVEDCRAGRGPVLIEVKTMRMKGHAQHDPAEYVPKAMFDYWKVRDPIARYEAFLTGHKLWDAKKKAEIDERIERELDEDQKFAEESPMPKPEQAKEGVYCEGCHTIDAEWKRPKKEVMPPAASAEAVWKVADFGGIGVEAGVAVQAASAGNGAKQAAEAVEEVAIEKQPPMRVPFGRGPKDRAFERERQEKHAAKPPRHKRRRR
ncbi:MAG TPA: thiamine pyrophosphate-dependent enzyme, partial [Candidatus Acidoferrales bacterium]|nr:thiamine pyrophosphate-dependent enzyme [Candidatus Acidoferrales bacterium]